MVNRFINNDQLTLMGGINNTNNMGFSDLASVCSLGWADRVDVGAEEPATDHNIRQYRPELQ